MSNFAMGTILGKGFARAQVHTNHSTSAKGTSAVMYADLYHTMKGDMEPKSDYFETLQNRSFHGTFFRFSTADFKYLDLLSMYSFFLNL